MNHFADRLAAQVRLRQTPVLVGLDPRLESLPASLRPADPADRTAAGEAYRRFCCAVVDVVAPLVPAVKPQAAFFEQLGPAGMTALHTVVQYARQRGLVVILDGKRNDIGSTATAYAEAYLGDEPASPWGADALTVSPYLGDDSIEPFVKVGKQRGSGLFVLVKTSNHGGRQFQDLIADGIPLYQHVAAFVERLAVDTVGESGYGIVGAVAGATYPQQVSQLRSRMPHTWFLVPGFGAQGGKAADVSGAFDDRGLGAIVNSSRDIIFAHSRREYRDRFGDARWQEAVEAATRDMIAQLQTETPAGRLK